jgi:hypothetical protein
MTVRTVLFSTFLLAACSGGDDTGSAIFDSDNDGSPDSEDCDDEDPDIYPSAPESCDGHDNDCDNEIDENPSDAAVWHIDADGDGYGIDDPKQQVSACTQPEGYSAYDNDCDDANAKIRPFATEVCDGIDNNCDGHIDSDAVDIGTWYADTDGDEYGDPAVSLANCDEPKGYVADKTDCDDTNNLINPTAKETCNGIDDDCDMIDEYCELPLADASVKIFGENEGDRAGSWIDSGDHDHDRQGDVFIGAASYTGGTDNGATYLVEGPIIDDLGLDEAFATYIGNANDNVTAAVSVGDIDGDANSDFAIGAEGLSQVYVMWGPVTASDGLIIAAFDLKVTTPDPGDGLGAIGSFDIADLTNDLKDDVAFGLEHDSDGGADAGAVSFFYGTFFGGTKDGSTISLDSDYGRWTGAAGDRAGALVESVGVVTEGIFPSFLIGAPGADKAYVVDTASTDAALEDLATATITGPPGTGTAAAGADVNGDGTGDLVLGASDAPGGGAAYVLFGPLKGSYDLEKDADITLTGAADGDRAGACVAAGDLTGDSDAEVAIGAPGNDATAADAGSVYVLFGGSDLAGSYVLGRTDRTYVGESAGDQVGSRCATVDDVSDDDVRDLALGAPDANAAAGLVYIMYSGDVY